jgi:hypothetical protein
MKLFFIYPPKISHGDQRTVWEETKICKFWKTFPLKIAIGGIKFPVGFLQAVIVTSSPFPHRNLEYTALLPFPCQHTLANLLLSRLPDLRARVLVY